MDTFVLGLIKAAQLIEDGRIDEFIKKKYSSFGGETETKILNNETSLEEIAAYAEKMCNASLPMSVGQESLESILNSIMFG